MLSSVFYITLHTGFQQHIANYHVFGDYFFQAVHLIYINR